MDMAGKTALISGGASGLGLATAQKLIAEGAKVVIMDLPTSRGAEIATELGKNALFVPGDVTVSDQIGEAITAAEDLGEFRALVHTAGKGGAVRLVDKEGKPGDFETFERVVRLNLLGTFDVLRQAAASMAKSDEIDGERGACVLTASVAGYEGQIGQIPYASAKAGIIGMTLVAARDLASKRIRVCTIAPGLFDTPLVANMRADVKAGLEKSVPNPSRLGQAPEYADLACTILRNTYLNGETIRLDGAIRMAPR